MCRSSFLEDFLKLPMVRDEHAPEEAEIEEEIQRKRDDFVTRFDVRCDRMLEYFEKHYENKKPKLEEGEQKVEWSAVLDCAEQIRMAAPIWITFDQQDMETLEENSKAFCSLLRKLLELAWKYMAGVKALPTLFQCIQDSVRSAYRRGLLVMDMAIDTHDYEEMRGCTVKRVVALWHTLEYLMRVPTNNGDAIKSCLMRTTANMYDTMCEIKGLGVGKAYNCVSTLFSMMIRVIPTFIKLLDTNGDRNRMSNFEELLNLVILMESKFKITRSLLDPQHLDLDHDPGIGDALRLAYSAVQNIEKILAQIKEADLPVCEVQGDKVDASGRDAAGISTIGLSGSILLNGLLIGSES